MPVSVEASCSQLDFVIAVQISRNFNSLMSMTLQHKTNGNANLKRELHY